MVGNDNGFIRFWDLSGAEPKELSPFDPNTAFLLPNDVGGIALDSPRGRMMLGRYDPPDGKYQQWLESYRAGEAYAGVLMLTCWGRKS